MSDSQTDPSGLLAPRFRPWLSLVALSLLFFVITAGTFTSLGVVLPDMVGQLGWNWSKAGLGYTLLATSCGLASYLPTVLVRRLGVKLTLHLGGGLMAAGFLALAGCRTVELYWLGCVLLGVGFALTAIIPGTYVLSRSFSHSSTAIGLYYTAGALGGVAGPAVFNLYKAAGLDWRVYWTCLGFAMALCGAVAAFSVDPAAEPDKSQVKTSDKPPLAPGDWSVAEALKTPQFWVITAAYTAYLLCETSLNGLSAPHLISRGLTPAAAGAMISLQALVNAGARSGAGWLGERINPKTLAVAALALVAAGIATLSSARDPMVIAAAVTGVGIGYGVSYLATTVLLMNAFGKSRNLELFSLMCLVSTLAAVGPFLGGVVKDASGGFGPAFQLFAGVCAVVLAALVAVKLPPKRA